MSDPTITSILTVPGLSTIVQTPNLRTTPPEALSEASSRGTAGPTLGRIVSVGLVLDGEKIAWGQCLASTDNQLPDYPDGLQAAEAVNTIHQIIRPGLVGRRLTSFRELAARQESLTETAVILETVPQENPERKGITRRELITGFLGSRAAANGGRPQTREVAIERSIHPAIRNGVSQALLKARALVQGVTMAEVIGEEYSIDIGDEPAAIQAEIDARPDEEILAEIQKVIRLLPATLGLTLSRDNPKEDLGEQGEILQRTVRRIRDQLLALAPDYYSPLLHVNVHSGLAQLHDHQLGKILGDLAGLEQAAAPYEIGIENPIARDGPQLEIEAMQRLKEFIRIRGMAVQLAAGDHLETLEAIKSYAEAGATDKIRIAINHLGGIQQSIEAILICREQGVGVLLDSEPFDMVAHVALATQPDRVAIDARQGAIKIAQFRDEIMRILVWLEARNAR
jgi:methylaspartate ammonia-lyase